MYDIDKPAPECGKCWQHSQSPFRECPAEALEQWFSGKRLHSFSKGSMIVGQGQPFEGLYCIQEGLVKVTASGPKQKEFILWFSHPGDLIGLDSFITSREHSISAMALTPVQACYIPKNDFQELVNRFPNLNRALMRSLCQRIDRIENRITSISRKKVREHFAEVLLSLAKSERQDPRGELRVDFPVRDLANLLGTTQNYLYKILAEFTGQNIVAMKHRKLFIRDTARLSHIAVGEAPAG